MIYNYLGKSGIQISAVSLGSWITFGNQISDEVAKQLMWMAYDKGVNFFDNAESYAHGRSEMVMGRILKDAGWERGSYMVSSKVFHGSGSRKPNQTGLSRKHIVEACDAALGRFQLDYLDLVFCHRPDPNTPIIETIWTMHQLIERGKILYWGTSEWSAQEIMEAHMVARQHHLIGPTMEQPEYNMFRRRRVEVEYDKLYTSVGLGTTIWSPLASGTLTDKYIGKFPKSTRLSLENLQWLKERSLTTERLDKIEKLNQLARELGTSLAKFAIAWCLQNPHVSTAILGASKPHQLEETLQALDLVAMFNSEINEKVEDILENTPG